MWRESKVKTVIANEDRENVSLELAKEDLESERFLKGSKFKLLSTDANTSKDGKNDEAGQILRKVSF